MFPNRRAKAVYPLISLWRFEYLHSVFGIKQMEENINIGKRKIPKNIQKNI